MQIGSEDQPGLQNVGIRPQGNNETQVPGQELPAEEAPAPTETGGAVATPGGEAATGALGPAPGQ